MKCPRCPDATLDERVREGITIDGCPTCRGVWLDRGELERLVARATAEIEAEVPADALRHPYREAPPPRRGHAPEVEDRRYFRGDHDGWGLRRHDDDDDDDDDDDRFARGRHRHPRKKRWFELLGDVFD